MIAFNFYSLDHYNLEGTHPNAVVVSGVDRSSTIEASVAVL